MGRNSDWCIENDFAAQREMHEYERARFAEELWRYEAFQDRISALESELKRVELQVISLKELMMHGQWRDE